MLIIPEIETVLILVPRTGSGSLRRAVAKRYPQAMLVYRHMEADGIPLGYDRWRKIGVVREPVARLWSLYKFLQWFDGDHSQAFIDAMRVSVKRPFEHWLLHNDVVFTSPYDRTWSSDLYYPQFTVRHPLPENRKSQYLYLRPDLGTEVIPFAKLHDLARALDVDLGHANASLESPPPTLSAEGDRYVRNVFPWDIAASTSEWAGGI